MGGKKKENQLKFPVYCEEGLSKKQHNRQSLGFVSNGKFLIETIANEKIKKTKWKITKRREFNFLFYIAN